MHKQTQQSLPQDPNVSFCGYSIPHPSERKVNLRIQTTGNITAAEALRQATLNLKQVYKHGLAGVQCTRLHTGLCTCWGDVQGCGG